MFTQYWLTSLHSSSPAQVAGSRSVRLPAACPDHTFRITPLSLVPGLVHLLPTALRAAVSDEVCMQVLCGTHLMVLEQRAYMGYISITGQGRETDKTWD